MDVSPIRFRAASDSDVDRVLELWEAARTPYAVTPDTPEAIGLLRRRDPEALLVAELDGRIVGAVIAAFDGWRGSLYRLAVDPDHRRAGIGAALIRAGENRLRDAGARRVSVLVAHADRIAVAAWTAAGYESDQVIGRFVKSL